MPDLQLRQNEAQLLYLAALYHLGRPGSERTPGPEGGGSLTGAAAALESQLPAATATLALNDYQLSRLAEALLGLVNELKQVALSGRSVTPGLIEAITRLYPDITPGDPGAALDLAGEATMLRRRLDAAVRASHAALEDARSELEAADDDGSSRRGWRFWRR